MRHSLHQISLRVTLSYLWYEALAELQVTAYSSPSIQALSLNVILTSTSQKKGPRMSEKTPIDTWRYILRGSMAFVLEL